MFYNGLTAVLQPLEEGARAGISNFKDLTYISKALLTGNTCHHSLELVGNLETNNQHNSIL